ncbi:MAG: polymer-forming cytoskeletal protein [Lachnospiraceae bacterium]|nr:polymer-forming cytoskeletal protein [Lachnospiraceae bacterium]
MRIAGSGSLPGGIYDDDISISGSGKITGSASCVNFHSSGSGSVDGDLMCQKDFHSSGSARVNGSLQAESISSSGSFKSDGPVSALETVKASGSFHAGGSAACSEFRTSGSAVVDGDLSADAIKCTGRISCSGLMSADTIDIRFGGRSGAGNIGGSSIRIVREGSGGVITRLISALGSKDGVFDVPGSIEGDEIYLENVAAASVTGRVVKIGPGCDIGQLFYIESAEISPNASVGQSEQIVG